MIINKPNLIRISILATSIAFILIGFFRGEIAYVFKNAIEICLRCIGLG